RDGTALLPVDRGQGRTLRRQDLAPDLHRAGRPQYLRNLSKWNLDVAAVRGPARTRAFDPRIRERAHHAARLRHRIRLLRSARTQALTRNQGHRGALLRRPDQWHDRLRRGRRTGPDRRPQRLACRARTDSMDATSRRSLYRRVDRRPDYQWHD